MIFCRPIRSAGVLSLLVAAAVGLTAEPADARPKKRAPTRTAKQVAPPKLVQVPLPRPSPLRPTAVAAVEIAVPLPRANPRTVEPEPTTPSLRLFAPNSPPPPPAPASTVSTAALKEPRLPPLPAEFVARELAFTAVIGESATGALPTELLSPSPLYVPTASTPAPATLDRTPRQVAAAIVSAVMPAPANAMPAPRVAAEKPHTPVPAATVPLPPLPPLAKRGPTTAAVHAVPITPPPVGPLLPLPDAPPLAEAAPAEPPAISLLKLPPVAPPPVETAATLPALPINRPPVATLPALPIAPPPVETAATLPALPINRPPVATLPSLPIAPPPVATLPALPIPPALVAPPPSRPALPPAAAAPAAELPPPPAEVAAVSPTAPAPEPEPAESGFETAHTAEDTTDVLDYASLAEVPDVVRQLAESLPECVPLDKGSRRQPFGERTLFSFACPADRPGDRKRAFVLARDERGSGANVVMFPRPGGKAVEPLHELSNPRVDAAAREFIHNAVDPKDRPCRQQGRWRIDDRGNAGLVGWRASNSCDGDWAVAAVSERKEARAAKASRGSKKSSAKKSSRGKGKAARKATPAKKKPVKKKR